VLGSSAVLQKIRERRTTQADGGSGEAVTAKAEQVLQQLCSYFKAHSGKRTSAQLVARFKAECSDAVLFRQLLRQVARQDGRVWILQDEFM